MSVSEVPNRWAESARWSSVLVAGAWAERLLPGIAYAWLGLPVMAWLIAFGFWIGTGAQRNIGDAGAHDSTSDEVGQ